MITVESLANAIDRIEAINNRFGINLGARRVGNNGQFAKELAKAKEAIDSSDSTGKEFQNAVINANDNAAREAAKKLENGTSQVQQGMDRALKNLGMDTTQLIQEAARKYNVDPRLVSAVAETESNGNQDVVSSAGAVGVMQLMPSTAASLGVNPYDKAQNIEGGTKYLRQMLDTFNGDVQKAVAAYNAGPGAVQKYGGTPPYKETQNYVNKVMDIYW